MKRNVFKTEENTSEELWSIRDEGITIDKAKCYSFSSVPLFATPWTVARQAPLSCDFPGKNTGVGSHSFLQGIFPTQGWNPILAGEFFTI